MSTTLTDSALECLCDYYRSKGGGIAALNDAIGLATEELISGVTITSVSFEGSGSSGMSNRSPQDLLDILGQVKRRMEGRGLREAATGNFRCNPIET